MGMRSAQVRSCGIAQQCGVHGCIFQELTLGQLTLGCVIVVNMFLRAFRALNADLNC